MISTSADSCSKLVSGNYDVLVNVEPSFKSILNDFLKRFELHEAELNHQGEKEQQPQQADIAADAFNNPLSLEHHLDLPSIRQGGYFNEFKTLKQLSKALKEDKANLEEGEQEYNLRKNRYKDILPFTHTRVILENDALIPGSNYINANYIKGPSGSPKAYIACQGPLQCTLNDFWRMIWECNVSVIVMACNEFESGKPKCELYWPEQVEMSQCYGNIQVTLVRVRHICSDFLIRKFSVKLLADDTNSQQINDNLTYTKHHQNESSTDSPNDDNNNNNNTIFAEEEPNNDIKRPNINSNNNNNNIIKRQVLAERTICQFHYTTWPDHGAPDYVQPILELVRLVRDVQPAEDKPILVHCSAGCGRTGTICCIDYVWGLLRRGKLPANFNLYEIISDMRKQRMSMVQTIEQYILCHRAVAALFMNQLKLIDDHVYENLDPFDDVSFENRLGNHDDDDDDGNHFELNEDEEKDLGPVFI